MSLFTFSANGKPLPWGGFFKSFEMMKSITDHPSRAVWSFWGLSQEAIAKAALAINQNLKFRWGAGGNMSIPHEYVIHAIDLKYIANSAFCKLHLIDCRVHMMANSAFSSYPHKSFSDIVTAIAGSYSKLPAAVVKADKYLADVLQTGANHWAFLSALKQEGCKASGNGDSDYRLFFKGGNELHFHPPDYTQAPYRTITVIGASSVQQMNLRANPWKPIVHGSVGYKTSQFLKNEVKPYSASSSQSSAFSGQQSLGNLQGGAKPIPSNFVGAFLGKFIHPHHDTAQLIEQKSKVGSENAVFDADHMEFSMIGDAGIEPGHLVKIVYVDPSGAKLEAHGLWLVEKVYHNIHEGSIIGKTKIDVTRTATSEIGSQKIPGLTSSTAGGGGNSQYSGANSSGGTVKQSSGVLGTDGNMTYWDSHVTDNRPYVWGQRTTYK